MAVHHLDIPINATHAYVLTVTEGEMTEHLMPVDGGAKLAVGVHTSDGAVNISFFDYDGDPIKTVHLDWSPDTDLDTTSA